MGVEMDFAEVEEKFKNWKQENKGENGCNWGQNWNAKRAQIISMPEDILECNAG